MLQIHAVRADDLNASASYSLSTPIVEAGSQLAVHPKLGKLFWSDGSKEIRSALLNGTGGVSIIETGWWNAVMQIEDKNVLFLYLKLIWDVPIPQHETVVIYWIFQINFVRIISKKGTISNKSTNFNILCNISKKWVKFI